MKPKALEIVNDVVALAQSPKQGEQDSVQRSNPGKLVPHVGDVHEKEKIDYCIDKRPPRQDADYWLANPSVSRLEVLGDVVPTKPLVHTDTGCRLLVVRTPR